MCQCKLKIGANLGKVYVTHAQRKKSKLDARDGQKKANDNWPSFCELHYSTKAPFFRVLSHMPNQLWKNAS